MLSPLLLTKLSTPSPQNKVVPRPHLLQQLQQAFELPVTILSAPAGFGKTTALTQWLHTIPQTATSWLSLDERDNDPLRYLTYLLTALYNLRDDDHGRYGLALLQNGATAETSLTAALNSLHQLSQPALLILDDYHVLEEAAAHQLTQFLIDHLPPALHLIITSRHALPLSLARLRARRQLHEITAADLRFTAAETSQLLGDLYHLQLSSEASNLLTNRTEGWVAGLQLAALSLEKLTPAEFPTFLESFGGDNAHIASYLLEEAWRHQAAEVQMFLLHTSILERFSLPLCQSVAPEKLDTAALFDYIQHANLFLIPLDYQRQWFRYHHLFRDFLRQQLSRSTLDQTKLQRRAAAWLRANDLYDEAMHHLTAAAAWDDAIDLINSVGFELFIGGNTNLVQGWLDRLPEEHIRTNPNLAVYRAVIRMNQYRLEEAERYFQYAERFLEELTPTATRHLIGQIASGRAGIASMRGDAFAITRQAKIAFAYLPPEDLAMRASVAYSLGFAYLHQGDYPAALRTFQQAAAQSKQSQSWHLFILSQIQLSYLYNARGEVGQAAAACQQLLDLHRGPPQIVAPLIGLACIGAAVMAWEKNQLDEALELTLTGLELCQLVANPQSLLSAYVTLIYLHTIRNEPELAHSRLQEAQQVVAQQPEDQWLQAMLAAITALVQAAQGQLEPAVAWLQTLDPQQKISFDGYNAVLQAYLNAVQLDVATAVYMAWAMAQQTADIWQAALQIFGTQRRQLTELGFVYPVCKLMAVEALAYQALGQREQATHLLSELLPLAQPRGYVLLFVQWGRPMQELLQTAVHSSPYARTLLTHFPDAPTLLLDPLTPREEEVLALIAAGLTNQQIAAELNITYGTTKRHVNSIYSKLAVNTRPQAILKAQEMGLG